VLSQGLASRVAAARAAAAHATDAAAAEADAWPLPPDATSTRRQTAPSRGAASARRPQGGSRSPACMVFVEKARVEPIKVALSLARARETADDM
jgi:hypothetical protein